MTLAGTGTGQAGLAWCRLDPSRDVLLLELHVQPGASRTQVCGLHGDRLKVSLGAPAVDGKANRLLIDFLSEHLAVAARQVSIVRGERSRHKLVMIEHPGAAARGVLLAWGRS